MNTSSERIDAMSSEEALALVRGWQEEVRLLPPAERSSLIERKLAELGPNAQRLARRILIDLLKPPKRAEKGTRAQGI